MPDPSLPVASLDEALPLLRRPFTPEAVKWKVQSVWGGNTGATLVAYIDARLVVERLNAVVGGAWEERYENGAGDTAWCFLTVFDRTHPDIGKASGIEKEKAVVSDALKRAAVKFGIGVSVYSLPQVSLRNDGSHNWLREQGQKKTLVLTDAGRTGLREGYRKWLEEKGVPAFGDPLDHGDVADAGGMEEEPAEEEFVAELPEPLNDEKSEALRTRIHFAYEGVDHAKVPPGKMWAWLEGAAHSHAELERLAVYLEGLRS